MSLRHVKKRCSVVHCDSVDSTIGVTLHRFPLDFHRCRAWAQFCRNVSLEKKAPSQLRELRICSRHFEPSVYLTSGRLRHDALPTRASIAGNFCYQTFKAFAALEMLGFVKK
ncbi:52 kDa repressor of the inhibitor of the protein kinase-like [Amblyomma americanum]